MIVILTGPESTGKSQLANDLALRFGTEYVQEYAREYISNLNSEYNYSDLEKIAKRQKEQMLQALSSKKEFIFFDTYLIITKIWFEVVFKKVPSWIDEEIRCANNYLYLLCRPDIPWVDDALRENGGHMRDVLFDKYETELRQANLKYRYVEGKGAHRLNCALVHIRNFRA